MTIRNRSMAVTKAKLFEGKYVILGVLLIGILGAVGGWWYNVRLQRRALALWGRDYARLIAAAGRVEAWQLTTVEAGVSRDTISVGGLPSAIGERRDVARSPGFAQMRQSLIHDGGFNWSAQPDGESLDWRFGLHFTDGERTATLLFDAHCAHALLVETGAQATINPMSHAIETFFADQFTPDSNAVRRDASF